MNYPNEHALLDHARHAMRERRAYADRAALLAAARAHRTPLASLRFAMAHRLARVARLLAAVAEDLEPATGRARRPVPMAPRRG
jgi:hypothetical protein